jgi:uncharacterized membrane protein YccC
MKRFLLGTLIGLFIGWITFPIVRADDEPKKYKDYLNQMLTTMKQMNARLESIDNNLVVLRQRLTGN